MGKSSPLIPPSRNGSAFDNPFNRDPTDISTKDIQFPKMLESGGEVEEQTLVQVEVVNDKLQRKALRSQLASKHTCLTRRWQTALTIGLVLLALAGAIGGLAYWITLPKVITRPFLLYGESCYMNSRSCDPQRMLWCPKDICLCIGNFQWNATGQNCSCGTFQIWNGLTCKSYGYFGDPCNSIPCRPTLTCSKVINQTYTTGQDVCVCDNQTYLETNPGANQGKCVPRIGYGQTCKSKSDCQNWLGLACGNSSSFTGIRCVCSSTAYWNGSICVQNALGWEPCSASILCDTTRGLTCSNFTNTCECNGFSYWDNVTTFWCEQKKTYAITCQFSFQCNATINLTCPTTVSTGCNCPVTSYTGICDCQLGTFWDGQRCTPIHTLNGTCPGSYACTSNQVCYLGHCVCPGNMVWNTVTPNNCTCPGTTFWNSTVSSCKCPANMIFSTTANTCVCPGNMFWNATVSSCICPGNMLFNTAASTCVCQGNMLWNVTVANTCACPTNTTFNATVNLCV